MILLFLGGGAAATGHTVGYSSHAPRIRGEFKPIATNVPGIRICEHLPKTAEWMHKTAIIRTVNHKAGCHNFLPAYTSHALPGSIARAQRPSSMGSVCEHLRQQNLSPTEKSDELPAYVFMPFYLG